MAKTDSSKPFKVKRILSPSLEMSSLFCTVLLKKWNAVAFGPPHQLPKSQRLTRLASYNVKGIKDVTPSWLKFSELKFGSHCPPPLREV